MGDQLYGDRARRAFERRTTDPPPRGVNEARQAYEAAYTELWRSAAFRDVLRGGPVYMMLDDHDVADDWGTTFTADSEPVLVAGALEAYERWQHAHNPSTTAGRYHYDVGFGDVAVFVLDARTQRGRDPAHPVLGATQVQDFKRWVNTTAAAADVIVVVAPVPLAFAPTDSIQQIVDVANTALRTAVAGSAGLLGGFLGGLVGGAIGYYLGEQLYDLFDDEAMEALGEELAGLAGHDLDLELRNGRVVEPDLADQWVTGDNRTELIMVLDELFALANDTRGAGVRPRAVLVLSGDIHLGMVHEIRSNDPAHAAWPRIVQFTSSPVSHEPSPHAIVGALETAGSRSADLDFPSPYQARMMFAPPALAETNFGILTITRTDPARRSYRIEGQIRGRTASMPYDWVVELDGPPPTAPPTPSRPRPR